MENIPCGLDPRERFDAFCKTVLRNAARSYQRDSSRRSNRERLLSAMSPKELAQLATMDRYPSEGHVFTCYGCDLLIDNEQVAAAFAGLPVREQSILILHCVLALSDSEIGAALGMSRSAVQRHRSKTLKELRTTLTALRQKEECQ